ncbi:MAG: Slp family lipoprotein [Saprospiraceae bacterium]|nr:Slp family lipoprotein [Saprospiraceae bacterium]
MDMIAIRLAFLFSLLLTACSNNLPANIKTAPSSDLKYRHVLAEEVDTFIGKQVRWGGKIIKVMKRDNQSLIEIQNYPVNRYGLPLLNLPTRGKFIAKSDQLLDPGVYLEGLLVTFSGTLDPETTRVKKRKIIFLPVITVTDIHLWPHKRINADEGYTYTGMESQFRFYGKYGSGYY